MDKRMIALSFLCAAVFLSLSIVYFSDGYKNSKDIVWAAGSSGKVSGFAWSETFGWISFNSKDCDIDNDETFEGNAEIGGPAPAGCPTSGAVNPYSVDSTGTGDLIGFAWSENVGWIYFGPDTADIGGGFGAQQISNAPNEPKIWAHYNSASGSITGWAKILSLGDDGWIKFSDDTVGVWNGKGVKLVSTGGGNYEFSGWAWNGDASLKVGSGWINFNSTDAGAGGSSYKVIVSNLVGNNAPSASDLTAPNWSYKNAADNGPRNANLSWSFDDSNKYCLGGSNSGNSCNIASDCPGGSCIADSQSAYQIIINTSDSTSTPLFDSGKVAGGASSYATTSLNWGGNYYWWVRVWDSLDTPSSWVQYTTNSLADTDQNADGNSETFSIFKHDFPDVSFTWTPTSPSKDENVNFTATGTVYLTASPTTPVVATDANADWLWTFVNGNPVSSVASTTVIQFSANGNNDVTLRVTDADGYYTETKVPINTKLKLPTWQEQKPQ